MKSHQLQETSLRYFLEVVRCGSIAEASQRLHVAGSAISRQIGGLEEVVGTALFERRPRGMVPSAAGELLAAHALKAALDADRVMLDILDLQGVRRGTVKVACTEGLAVHFMPRVIVEFRKTYPGVAFQVHVCGPGGVTERIRNGDSDIGLTFSRTPAKDIRVEHRQQAAVTAVMRSDHPLAGASRLTLAQLAEHPLALPSPDISLRQIFDFACSEQLLLVEPALSSNCATTIHQFVLQGGGLTIAGLISVQHFLQSGEMRAVPISDRSLEGRSLELQTLQGRALPRVVQTFLTHLQAQVAGIPQSVDA